LSPERGYIMTDTDMRREPLSYDLDDGPALTFGLHPGVAGVYMEHQADVYCPTCAEDILYEATWDRVQREDIGYDHPQHERLGNVAAVLASEEWDCPGATCGHCGVPLDVKAIHYDGVCQPRSCPHMDG
jgi:hypothetical protein